MTVMEDRVFASERALYAAEDLCLRRCAFAGEEDGESALKESRRIRLEDCRMELRYPFWHDRGLFLLRCDMTETCRAALWYSEDIAASGGRWNGVKALRECRRAEMTGVQILSPEFGWRCRDLRLTDCTVQGEYPFLMTDGLTMTGGSLTGKYSFQYAENVTVTGTRLDTKDAFWHSRGVTVRDAEIKGEYLGWYSQGLTLINCRIIGTQPLCYCTDLRLIDCEMVDADLAFEYSDVQADLRGEVVSVKNPRSGHITVGRIGEILLTDDSRWPCTCVLTQTD